MFVPNCLRVLVLSLLMPGMVAWAQSAPAHDSGIRVETNPDPEVTVNADVLEAAYAFDDGGGYEWRDTGTPEALVHDGQTLLERSAEGTYCCGYTLAVVLRAARSRGLLEDVSFEQIQRFHKDWYGIPTDVTPEPETLVVRALEQSDLGHAVPLEDALPGDFVQLWRESGSGHSVVLVQLLREEVDGAAGAAGGSGAVVELGAIIGLRYRSSQGSTDGIGDREEFFLEHGGTVLLERTYVGRLNAGAAAENQESPDDALESESSSAELPAERSALDWPAAAAFEVTPDEIFWLDSDFDALVLPLFEGVYVHADDAVLGSWLIDQSPILVTEGFSLPVFGLVRGDQMETVLLPDPYYAEVVVEAQGESIRIGVRFESTSNRPGAEFRIMRRVDPVEPTGLLAPALYYRAFQDALPSDLSTALTLHQKIEANPAVEALIGAIHVYVWGNSHFSRHDVRPGQWAAFAQRLVDAGDGNGEGDSQTDLEFLRNLWSSLSEEAREALRELTSAEFAYAYLQRTAAAGINEVMGETPSHAEVAFDLRSQLATVYPEHLNSQASWGDGASITLMDSMHEAGIQNALLLTGDLYSAAGRGDVAEHAASLGYLLGPYDSYHSIHSLESGENDSWETARFDEALYETGRIMGLDGEPRRGFKQRGYLLSPSAAWPYVQQRVNGLRETVPFNAWFVDCDAFGQYLDDTHPDHPATRLDDAAARRARLLWMSEHHGLVVGSEGATAVMAPAIHFGHGVMTPVIGWGDERLKDSESPNFMGRYWPPDEPGVFFDSVPLLEDHRRPYFTPQDRLPLYQAALGDCVIATHHWGYVFKRDRHPSDNGSALPRPAALSLESCDLADSERGDRATREILHALAS